MKPMKMREARAGCKTHRASDDRVRVAEVGSQCQMPAPPGARGPDPRSPLEAHTSSVRQKKPPRGRASEPAKPGAPVPLARSHSPARGRGLVKEPARDQGCTASGERLGASMALFILDHGFLGQKTHFLCVFSSGYRPSFEQNAVPGARLGRDSSTGRACQWQFPCSVAQASPLCGNSAAPSTARPVLIQISGAAARTRTASPCSLAQGGE